MKPGEYACYGSGGRVLIGLGFIVTAPGRFTDLDHGNAGSYQITGDKIKFSGGHLEGTVGRELKKGRFRVGTMAECEPY